MPTKISSIETLARQHLVEATASFWSSEELVSLCVRGVKDLWRDIVDLKQEHYLTVNTTDVFLGASSTALGGVPTDVHKVYMIEPADITSDSTNVGLSFLPLDYNHRDFNRARAMDAQDPSNTCVYYCITGQGAPVAAPTILVAPQITSLVRLHFIYVPTLPTMTADSFVPIPGEADNALVAWTVAWARAKEREDRSPDPSWIGIYASEKQHLLQSLGQRQYQEPQCVNAMFEDYWG